MANCSSILSSILLSLLCVFLQQHLLEAWICFSSKRQYAHMHLESFQIPHAGSVLPMWCLCILHWQSLLHSSVVVTLLCSEDCFTKLIGKPTDSIQNNWKCKKTHLETEQAREQSYTKLLWSLNKGTKSKYEEIIYKSKWIYQHALINKQLINKKADTKRKSRTRRERRDPLRPCEEHTEV